MEDRETLDCLYKILEQAKALANEDAAALRVAGERISVIVVDVLYELDFSLADVTSLLPLFKREQTRPHAAADTQ